MATSFSVITTLPAETRPADQATYTVSAIVPARLLTVALFDDVGVMGRDDVGGFGNAPPGVSAGRSSSW